ncbi:MULTISPECIES: HvfC/BufC N-terminal domain-containing protein [Chryseobacterium]|uniref:Putative DNA-binding domain-containing protein n=1 Tax=Chryseobacterium camelliae TaxID=1265445 RepID=A0ABU0TJ40_9FLAO|nr:MULTISPECIES: DNA-binding domain-containing protein [Chryseobacterium]MDT3409073.1 hypothetical protein [Pseudacidovorax intermedius]MDQ1097069.1 hypothetical protein [Chryseobacterium camelliae]MDQ1101007.1 hypothetical protein [Chryseobacterium sp. SORGH_AS_1048]MDR6084449.1 hypothetical protein [Chryseobacterium sp. SORGH_AS_0909]MDR6132720.1 hypothetical protein [Chryseobacterium sp. SORGH_AS_1175]
MPYKNNMSSQSNEPFSAQRKLGYFCRTNKDMPTTSLQDNTQYYRDLVFNVVEDTLETSFPIARKNLGKKKWKKLVQHFFSNNACQTPILWKLPLEFYEFYQKEALPLKEQIPYFLDLLHFEWIETEVYMMQDILVTEKFSKDTEYANNILVGNPEIKILTLQYPVHLKRGKNISEEDCGQYFVSIHRGYDDKQVYFNDLSYPYVEMLVRIHEEYSTIEDLENILAKYENEASIIKEKTTAFLDFCLKQQIILGLKKTSHEE